MAIDGEILKLTLAAKDALDEDSLKEVLLAALTGMSARHLKGTMGGVIGKDNIEFVQNPYIKWFNFHLRYNRPFCKVSPGEIFIPKEAKPFTDVFCSPGESYKIQFKQLENKMNKPRGGAADTSTPGEATRKFFEHRNISAKKYGAQTGLAGFITNLIFTVNPIKAVVTAHKKSSTDTHIKKLIALLPKHGRIQEIDEKWWASTEGILWTQHSKVGTITLLQNIIWHALSCYQEILAHSYRELFISIIPLHIARHGVNVLTYKAQKEAIKEKFLDVTRIAIQLHWHAFVETMILRPLEGATPFTDVFQEIFRPDSLNTDFPTAHDKAYTPEELILDPYGWMALRVKLLLF